MSSVLENKKYSLSLAAGRLNGVSPLEKLSQGYSYAVGKNAKNIRSIEQLEVGESITVYVSDGKADATVVSKEKLEYNR